MLNSFAFINEVFVRVGYAFTNTFRSFVFFGNSNFLFQPSTKNRVPFCFSSSSYYNKAND